METYKEFLHRIDSFEKRKIDYGNQYFLGNPSLSQKVFQDNTFKHFYGDTVVFALDDLVIGKLAEYVDFLYQAAPECFCERLLPHTFHVTLHDLCNAPVLRDIAGELSENEFKVNEKKREIQKQGQTAIKMISRYFFNMVDTSLVLGLYPASEKEYLRLMELYTIFDAVRKLSYPFTPHITLAYYNINGFDLSAARNLEAAVSRLNHKNKLEIELKTERLCYQKFRSMNDYTDIIKLGI